MSQKQQVVKGKEEEKDDEVLKHEEANEEMELLKFQSELIPKPPRGKRRYIDILLNNMSSTPRLKDNPSPKAEKEKTPKSKSQEPKAPSKGQTLAQIKKNQEIAQTP